MYVAFFPSHLSVSSIYVSRTKNRKMENIALQALVGSINEALHLERIKNNNILPLTTTF